jgi:multiple sugar transport system permease protein
MKKQKLSEQSRKLKKNRNRFRFQDSLLGYATIFPATFVLIGFFGYPLFYEVYASFTNSTVGQSSEWVGLANYSHLFNDPSFRAASLNTIIYVTSVQSGKFLLGLAVALLLSQQLRGRNIWRALVLVPYALPGFVAYAVWRLIYNPDVGALNIFLMKLGIIDSPIAFLSNPEWAMPSVVVATIWKGFPFWTIMFLAALQSIPKELYEAAATDGANGFQKFKHISLPGIRPVILIVFMISTITTLNSFEAIWLTTGGGPGTSTTILPIYAYKSLVAFQIGESAAAALALVPVLFILVFFVMRKLKKD